VKKKLILMCIAGALVMTGVIGGTLAGFNTETKSKAVTDIKVNTLGIDMLGDSDSEEPDATTKADGKDIKVVPGGDTVIQHNIKNDVEGGYDLYTRVTIDKKWADSKKENVSLDPEKIRVYAGTDDSKQELLAGVTVNDWIVWYSDAEQIVMYYTKPLASGETTANFIDSLSFATDMNNDYADEKVELAFSADAVQVIAAEDSIPSEWGVYPEFNENGEITKIVE